MTTIILVCLGLFIGVAVADEEGLVFGLFIGLAFSLIANLKSRMHKLEQELIQTKALINTAKLSEESTSFKSEHQTEILKEEALFTEESTAVVTPTLSTLQHAEVEDVTPKNVHVDWNETAWQKSEVESNSDISVADKIVSKIHDFFTTGNVVVKVGAIVLFFGLAFLLKYAAERSMFPIELRLLSVVVIGIAMLVIGWRLRFEKLEYGLILQGAGVGTLYLTVFAASKLYHVLPMAFSFVVMVILVAFSGFLAVRQNAKSLAIFGVTGGFLAPILMSTGTGSHITLFSYYALLNVGIFAIAWFKSWRDLNLVGFLFTFAISAAWGYKAYLPEHFVSSEAFLILFYLFYLIIPILYAFKQKPQLKGYVDGTLIFGLPLIAFALQGGLVEPFEYGQAISASVLAIIYLVLAKTFWLPEKEGFRLLGEAYLALGVTFASLAVPLALDNRWTAAVWSLEGAGLVWIGFRQTHLLSRLFGILLSVGAGIAFIESINHHLADSLPILNSAYIGMVLVSLSAFFIAYLYNKYQQGTYSFEQQFSVAMIIWGLIWWFYAGAMEIDKYATHRYELKALALFIAVSTFLQVIASHQLRWPNISLSAFLLTPLIVLLLLGEFIMRSHINPLAYLGYIVWPAVLFVHILVLRRKENSLPRWMLTFWHAIGVMITALITTWAMTNWLGRIDDLSDVWINSAIGLVMTLFAVSVLRWGHRFSWPVAAFSRSYYSLGLLPLMLVLMLWQIFSATQEGTPSPLSYIPILNPYDIAQGLAIAVMIYWLWFIAEYVENKHFSISPRFITVFAGIMSFVWINVIIARSVHSFGNVTYSDYALLNSNLFQTSTSVVWGVIAMLLMMMAFRKASRFFWFAGASLLALVVVKLFFVDLSDSGSISRIISFLVVGGLMLIIGYLSPLPPKTESE